MAGRVGRIFMSSNWTAICNQVLRLTKNVPMKKAKKMNEKMDRTEIMISNAKALEKSDREYWAAASIEEKLKTITYLRECFYGVEATTGRGQKFYQVFNAVRNK